MPFNTTAILPAFIRSAAKPVLAALSMLIMLPGCNDTAEHTSASYQLPKNIDDYRQQAALSVQEGKAFSLDAFELDSFKLASTEQASSEQPQASGQPYRAVIEATTRALVNRPGAEKVVYFEIIDRTAYVVLAMDQDGWAGISATLAAVRPMITHNLLRFDEIEAVKFGQPGEE